MVNHNAKGRKPIFGEVAKNVTFKLYSWEKQLIKDYIKKLRENNSHKI